MMMMMTIKALAAACYANSFPQLLFTARCT